ncbi:MAG: FtsX-like permease family protein [Bacilli bacterium]|nr:FtsX-like permease family protein [Bacilli bacterium]
MRMSNLFKIVINNIKRNKSNFFFVILLIMLNVTVIVGFSYYNSLISFWSSMTEKSYDFNIAYINSSKRLNEAKENPHVLDIFSFAEYNEFGVFSDLVTEALDGSARLIGGIPNIKKIVSGSDLTIGEDEIICPNNFYPDSNIYSGGFDKNKIVNLEKYIGEKIKIRYLDEYDIELKLAGVFDASSDFSYPDACYVNHSTLKKLNLQYQSKKAEKDGFLVFLDDIDNINDVFSNLDESSYVRTTQLDTEAGNNVLRVISIAGVILIVIFILFCYAISSRRVVKEAKNIGILKVCGYKDTEIKKIFYLENIILAIISYVLSFVISVILIKNISALFLQTDPILYNMNVHISLTILVFEILITLISLFLSTCLSLKTIDSLDLGEIIND